jgi:hypothetical protein
MIDGNLSTQRGDSGDWVADTINTPVMPGDTLSTGPKSRTEVQLDYANVLRLADNAVAKVADLTEGRIQIQVSQGLVDYVVIRDGDTSNTEVDSPNLAVHPLGRGVFRIRVISPTETVVTVREGQVQVATPQGSTNVNKGQMITVKGSDNPQYKIDEAQARDDWDRWNADRDKEILSASSWQHTDPYYTGSNDLDQYGQWQNAPGYGDVWQPQVGSDWSPYSDGSWAWEPDYGWTWVSGEPWGWAPYHYGRWFMWNNAWAWWPGPIGAGWGFGGGWYRPIWAPAYVNFFGWGWGGGLGFGFGFGFGGGWGRVGWLPCGPGDRFFPWFGRGRGFNVTNVSNITNITNINNIRGGVAPLAGGRNLVGGSNLQAAMTNSRVLHGINTVAGNKFGQGAVRPERGAVSAGMLKNASFVSGKLGVVPTKASLSASGRAPAANSIHSSVASSHFAGTPASAVNRGAFAQQQASARQLSQNLRSQDVAEQGRSNADRLNRVAASSTNARAGSAGGTRPTAETGRPGTLGNTANRSFGSAQSGGARPASQSAQPSWQQFANRGSAAGSTNRSFTNNPNNPRGLAETQTARPGSTFSAPRAPQGATAQQGWQRFSSQPAPHSSFSSPARPQSSFGSRSTAPSYRGGGSSYGAGASGAARPPLQMNRPMFSPRSAPSYGGYSAPRSSGAYGGHGGYSAPRSYSAPRPSGGGGSGHYSGGGAGHSGGGQSAGGGGGHSGGGGGGGGHSGGGGRH